MNLSLDPNFFTQGHPEGLTRSLVEGHSVCVKFNRLGDYLACGQSDGTILIYDYDTYGIIKILRGHVASIQSISWSQDGRHLLSASRDWKCILWDLSTGKEERVVRFNGPILIAELHPRDPYQFVASLYEDNPQFVDITTENDHIRTILPTLPEEEKETYKQKILTLCTTFTPKGQYIISGTSKGTLNVIDVGKNEIVYKKVSISNSSIKFILLGPLAKNLVLNSSDRIIRLLSIPSNIDKTPPEEWNFEMKLKLQDFVNKRMWSSTKLTSTEDYIAATTFGHSDIYLWDTDIGSLTKIFDGPKEEMVDLDFHPLRAIMASTGLDSGDVHLWEATMPQRWSALAPDFQELEANVEYEEREDEFDVIDEEEQTKRQRNKEEENVDVLTKQENEYTDSFVIPIILNDYDQVKELI